MNQIDSMAIPVEGRMTTEELFELKNKMNTKALAKRRRSVTTCSAGVQRNPQKDAHFAVKLFDGDFMRRT